jgi:4-hydroxy-tetrahydrodipicolinate synthase
MRLPSDTPPAPVSFTGLWIPLVTPFRDGAVDHPALRALVRKLAPRGIAGFVACGSTGEAAAFDADEQLAVLDTVLAAADGLPVVMGVGGYNLPRALAMATAACEHGAAGLLIAPPCYVRPAQAGVLDWFRTLADASTVPVVLYDIPYRTGVELPLATLLALAEHPRIRALKDCGGDAAKTQALIADGRLALLAGEDAQIFGAMALGAAGAIAASAHLHTERFVRVIALLAEGRLHEARALWQPLQPWIAALFSEPNPGPVKALLAHAGDIGPDLRAPMTPASAPLLQRLLALQAPLSRP